MSSLSDYIRFLKNKKKHILSLKSKEEVDKYIKSIYQVAM